ncbi:MAG: hypothetical protein ACLFQV_14180 [Vulcanimicrobiota bacterium]
MKVRKTLNWLEEEIQVYKDQVDRAEDKKHSLNLQLDKDPYYNKWLKNKI